MKRQVIKWLVVAVIIYLAWLVAPAKGSQDNPTREELLQTVKHIAALAKETQGELDAEKAAHSQTQSALDSAISSNHDTQMQFASYQLAAETQIKKGNDAIAQLNGVIKKLHRAKWILCGIWVLLVGLAITKVPLPLKAYGIYIGAGLVAAGCAFIWWWV